MKSIIIGTAGHVDHGKTALVKALTGIDADRLQEEKRRGITIDLGFAHMELSAPSGETIRMGFIDVPGHERFVRNMLAGVGGIDLVLFVIAADEAIKPQTREHFDILQLLGVQRGITVLTKSDAVDAETLEVVKLEVREFLRGTFLEGPAPTLAVSALTGAGISELKAAMVGMAASVQPRDSQALARLPIDRVFTMKGFGTVATGTLIAGTIRREDELELQPGGKRVRVRGVQVHGRATDAAVAGQRTALNLAGADVEEIGRGQNLIQPGQLEMTRRVDVLLRLLPSAPRPLKKRTRVHFHSYTMETVAEITPYEAATNPDKENREAHTSGLQPGHQGFARIMLAQPALLLPGDRFITRQFSPVVTIGGGTVLDAAPIARQTEKISFLQSLAGSNGRAILAARINRRRQEGISLTRLIAETGWTQTVLDNILNELQRSGEVVRANEVYLSSSEFAALQSSFLRAISDFHVKNPLAQGIGKEELRSRTRTRVELFEPLMNMLLKDQKIEVSGDLVRLPGHGVVMKDEEAESKKKIEEAFSSAGLKVPALQEVIAGLKIDRTRAQKIVTLLLRDKLLVKISEDLVFHQSALQGLKQQIAAYKAKSATIDVPRFKELTGVSRKYAIPLLEFLDRERITRRVGDARSIL